MTVRAPIKSGFCLFWPLPPPPLPRWHSRLFFFLTLLIPDRLFLFHFTPMCLLLPSLTHALFMWSCYLFTVCWAGLWSDSTDTRLQPRHTAALLSLVLTNAQRLAASSDANTLRASSPTSANTKTRSGGICRWRLREADTWRETTQINNDERVDKFPDDRKMSPPEKSQQIKQEPHNWSHSSPLTVSFAQKQIFFAVNDQFKGLTNQTLFCYILFKVI